MRSLSRYLAAAMSFSLAAPAGAGGGAPSAAPSASAQQLQSMAGAAPAPAPAVGPVATISPSPQTRASACGQPAFRDVAATLPADQAQPFAQDPADSLSKRNLAAFRAKLGALTAEESALVAKATANPPYVTYRLSPDRLRSVLGGGEAVSPRALHHKGADTRTPQVEEDLFGGYDCVFAAVGPAAGRPRYGEVALRVDDAADIPGAWASTGSGMHFMCTRYHKPFPCADHPPVGSADRVAFAERMYARKDWNEEMALSVVHHLRDVPAADRSALTARLLAAQRKEFWDIVDEKELGYLEAKFPDALTLDKVSSIEVPGGSLAAILAWPEASAWTGKIAAATADGSPSPLPAPSAASAIPRSPPAPAPKPDRAKAPAAVASAPPSPAAASAPAKTEARAAAETATSGMHSYLPELLTLEANQPIPAETLKGHSSDAVAETLVERLRRQVQPPAVLTGAVRVDMWKDTQLHKFAQSKNFARFIRSGFQNVFQSGVDKGGVQYLNNRNRVEERLIGLKLGTDYQNEEINALRPKYGIVFFPNFETSANRYLKEYGDFLFVMKDELKDQATWIKGNGIYRLTRWNDPFKSGRTFQETVDRSYVSAYNDTSFEFQAWGDMSIEDVEAIGATPDTPKEFIDQVSALGFKVVRFETYRKGSNSLTSYRFAQTLSNGDPQALAAWLKRAQTDDLEYALLFKNPSTDVAVKVGEMEKVVGSAKTADQFLRLLEPGYPTPSDNYKQALDAFATKHADEFLALSPTPQQCQRFKQGRYGVDAIMNLQSKLAARAKTPAEFLEAARLANEKPSDAYRKAEDAFFFQNMDAFLKLGATLDDVGRFITQSNATRAGVAIRETYAARVADAASFESLFSPQIPSPSDGYLKAVRDAYRKHWAEFMKLQPTDAQLEEVWKTYPPLKAELETEIAGGHPVGETVLIDGATVGKVQGYSLRDKTVEAATATGSVDAPATHLSSLVAKLGGLSSGDKVCAADDPRQVGQITGLFADGHIQVAWEGKAPQVVTAPAVRLDDWTRAGLRFLGRLRGG